MTSEAGKSVILNGWEKSGITNGIKLGKSKLPRFFEKFRDSRKFVTRKNIYQ